MRVLYHVPFGSRLFGTNLESSDHDYKMVYAPSLDSLLLGNRIANEPDFSQGIDAEKVPIQILARHYFEGQSYAIEVVQAEKKGVQVEGTETDPLFRRFCAHLRAKWTCRNMSRVAGYAKHQSSLYSDKGVRYEAAHALMLALSLREPTTRLFEAVQDPSVLAVLEKYSSHIYLGEYDISSGQERMRMRPCLYFLGKCLPLSIDMRTAQAPVQSTLTSYGKRAIKASDHGDWKAIMHALRIAREGVTLLSSGGFRFAYEEPLFRDYLISVRKGERPLEEVLAKMDQLTLELRDMEEASDFPDNTSEQSIQDFNVWLASWLRDLYGIRT